MSALLWEVQVAMVEAILADSLNDLLQGNVRDSEYPEGETRPHLYMTVGEIPGQVPFGLFGDKQGRDALIWMHIWDDGTREDGTVLVSKERCLTVAAGLERLFHGKRIILSEHLMMSGEITNVRVTEDRTDGVSRMHGLVQYRVVGKTAPVAP